MDLFDLEQLVAFKRLGTLSRAAEELHLAQPTLTKTMKRLEDEFKVSLFERGKNKISLNQNGELAAAQAERILNDASNMINMVRSLDRSLHTIMIGTCLILVSGKKSLLKKCLIQDFWFRLTKMLLKTCWLHPFSHPLPQIRL